MGKFEVHADRTKLLPKTNYTEGRGRKNGKDTIKVKHIVIHYNAGNLSLDSCYDALLHRKTSAHYQVDQYGKTCQYVYDSNTAWHAGNWPENQKSIGIEHANYGGNGNLAKFTDATLKSGAKLVAGLCVKFGLGSPEWMINVFPHNHFKSTSCPGSLEGKYRETYMKYAQEEYARLVK